jgi:peroxiredoxin
LRDWHEKYRDEGLVVIGVHSPEFAREHKLENLQAAMERLNVTYPVTQDNDFRIWRSYRNRFWPTMYLVDKNGHIRYVHIGEGGYEETEEVIQALLAEE